MDKPSKSFCNGKYYPMWGQFVEKESEWIGGILQDFGDQMDRAMGLVDKEGMKTTITGIKLEPNGKDSACFCVEGKDFTCSGAVEYLGMATGEGGWITLSGYGDHTWRFKKP